jgi:DNA-damage-inducible protein D
MTNNIVPTDQNQSPFDSIRRYRSDGSEFWSARDLMPTLGYKTWQKFNDALDRAMTACENTSNRVTEHFLPMSVNIKQAE